MRSLDAILFDLGGTLDGRDDWRRRFDRLFDECGIVRSTAERDRAFEYAQELSHATPEMATSCLRDMLRRHVGWQLESLRIDDPQIGRIVIERFAAEVAEAAAVNCRLLASLTERGFRIGIVSNACGNCAVLCEEYGYAPFISALVDSDRFGRAKPDLEIFRHALALLGTTAERTGFVGDSLERDIRPAKALGMRTFWVTGSRADDADGAADAIIDNVTELPAYLDVPVPSAQRSLRAGIFAAGVGARLGSSTAKGLTRVAGRPLIDWILDDLADAGVSEIVMIINEQSTALREHVGTAWPIRWIVETTPSSMHSFLRVMETLAAGGDQGPFLISTVDTIAPPGTFRMFVDRASRAPDADAVLALTTRIGDDNPLLISGSDPDYERGRGYFPCSSEENTPVPFRIEGLTPITAIGCGKYATAGYYLVRSTVLAEADAGRTANLGALRQFFRHLFDRGYRLSGVCMPDSIDVDRPSDVKDAERLLRTSVS
jgi:HAD superfamily hydrolase (TIGR01549 family)